MADETVATPEVEQTEVPETFTAKELQSAKDSAYDKARADIAKDYEAKLAQAIEDAKQKAIEESKMTAEQKAQAELDDKIKKLEEREAGIKQRELTADVTTQLSSAGLPVDLAESLTILGDKTATEKFIESVSRVIQEQTNAEITKRANAGKPSGTPSALDNADDPIKQALRKAGL